MAYWFLLKNQTHEARTMSQWVGALAAPQRPGIGSQHPQTSVNSSPGDLMPPFAPPDTACTECGHRHTHAHMGVGGGGREGERAKTPILTK